MSLRIFPPVKARFVSLSDDDHRKFLDLGGSPWLRRAVREAWDRLPPEAGKWKPFDGARTELDQAWRKL